MYERYAEVILNSGSPDATKPYKKNILKRKEGKEGKKAAKKGRRKFLSNMYSMIRIMGLGGVPNLYSSQGKMN